MPDSQSSAPAIDVVVNGKLTQVPSACTVAELLERLEIKTRAVAVEINQDIKPHDQFAKTELQAGDRLEIVTLVGGG